METNTTSETTFRAVFLHDNNAGRSSLRGRFVSADEAWKATDGVDVSHSKGHWVVEKTTVTTTTTEVAR